MLKKTLLEIVTIGDELLLGIREDNHLLYLGGYLTRHGLSPRRNRVIRDQAEEIRCFFRQCWENTDIVITTGGLGPTRDDITRETIAQVLGLALEHNDAAEKAIREYFARRGRDINENTLRQAKIFKGAEILPNRLGTAPGMWLKKDGKYLIMLPGPAVELQLMFEEQVLPRLQAEGLTTEDRSYLQLRTCGVGESQLETLLNPIFGRYKDRLAVSYCAHENVVDVRLRVGDESGLSWNEIEAIGEECKEVMGEDFIGFGDCSIASLVLSQLRALGKTLAVAESCTGGLLSNAFTDITGASKVFAGGVICYNNDTKVQMLEVPDVIVQQHGAVSPECAVALATGAAEKFSVDYALSVTGFAGPSGGTKKNPIGTIYLGYHSPVGVWSRKVVLPGNRLTVKTCAVTAALDWVRRKLKKYEVEDILASMAC